MTIKWFGKMYTAPVYFETPEAATPAGADCFYCEEVIAGNDDGWFDSGGNPFHRPCWLRMVIGSVAHIEGRCSCFVPGADEGDAPGLTKRAAAEAALRAFERAGYEGHKPRN